MVDLGPKKEEYVAQLTAYKHKKQDFRKAVRDKRKGIQVFCGSAFSSSFYMPPFSDHTHLRLAGDQHEWVYTLPPRQFCSLLGCPWWWEGECAGERERQGCIL